jgi:hypothetical protein
MLAARQRLSAIANSLHNVIALLINEPHLKALSLWGRCHPPIRLTAG